MHVLIVTNYFAPEGGAAAVRLTRLARKLQQRGHQITVLTSLPHYPQGEVYQEHRGRLTVTTELDGIRIVQTWLLATPSPRISRKALSQITFMLTASLQGLRLPTPDVVLVEGQPIFTGLAGAFIATIKRRPYVLNVSDLWPDHLLSVGVLTETHPLYRLARRVTDAMYRRASAIVAMSPHWAETIKSHIDTSTAIHVIINGVDLRQFHNRINADFFRQRHGIDKKAVTFLGTFSTPYDFDTMLKAIDIVSMDRDFATVVIGRGSQEGFMSRYAESHGGLIWIPWLDHDEIPQAWNASYATCWAIRDHALYSGTIPAKLFEAMACGVPVLAAIEGVAARIIEESGGGAVVPCGDVSGLARILAEVLDQECRRETYSKAARQYAEAHFDAERVVAAYERVLLSAVAAHSGQGRGGKEVAKDDQRDG